MAVIRQDRIELGEAALKSAHIDPRNTFSRFWSNLNQDNFKHPTKLARHNADLAFAHLLSIHELAGKADEMVFAVPGSFTTEQLSLLLGLGEASPFSITGLVDSAVAATAATAGAGTYHHLDVHLHHTVMTTLEVSESVNRTAVKVINDVGLTIIHNKCADVIADLFIQQSRFDPLHHAETEQALYDRLPHCLQSLQEETEALFEIQYGNTRYQARISRELLVDVLRPLYDKISVALDPSRTCLVNKRLADLPAFTAHLAAVEVSVEVLDERAVFAGCMSYILADKPADEGVYFVTQLKATAEPVVNPASKASQQFEKKPDSGATHVLGNAQAHPINQTPLYLSAGGTVAAARERDSCCSVTLKGPVATLDLESRSAVVFINGQAVAGSTGLYPGDVISFTGATTEFTLIRVLT